MIYRIVLDGEDIMDPFNKKLFVLSPDLEMEINTAGSLSFMVGSDHAFYNQIHMLKSNIEVYEDDELIWFGRPVEQKFDFIKRKSIYCEGALAFFNDTIQQPTVYDQVSLHTFFKNVIAFHNAQVAEDRKFTVGSLTIADKPIYRKIGYENTFDVLKTKCLEAEGGYFFCRRENGINYIDWLKDIPNESNQPIEFGLNLLDLNINFDGTSFATAVIPLGKKTDDDELTIASVNNGSIILESDAVETYGRVTTVVNFSDITDASKLKEEGKKYLENTQFNSLIIECTAADLHFQNENYGIFKIGQMIHCRSNPHVLDRDLPLAKISLRLDTAAKQITLGIIPKKSLTRFYKENTNTIDGMKTNVDGLTDYVGYNPTNTTNPESTIDKNINNLYDNYNNLNQQYNNLTDYLGYGDGASGNNILDNLDSRITNLENNTSGGNSGYYYPKIWIGTESQYMNNEAQYIKTLDTAPVVGKSYYTFDKTIPAYKEYIGDHFNDGVAYYERYSPTSELIISFIVDELPDGTKRNGKKIPSGWEVDTTDDSD